MMLSEYLDGMREASTADDLEAAIQVPFDHSFQGRTWSRICNVRIEAGERICDAHPNGRFVPRFGPRRRLSVCGQEVRVGRGGNSTGIRYIWYAAEEWARDILRAEGFSRRACHAIWGPAFDYPHRSLKAVEQAFAGELPDPPFGELIEWCYRDQGNPVRVNRSTEADERAHRPCQCGDGWLWDWGAGWSGYALFINWYCDRCPRRFTEYVTKERLTEIRSRPALDRNAERVA